MSNLSNDAGIPMLTEVIESTAPAAPASAARARTADFVAAPLPAANEPVAAEPAQMGVDLQRFAEIEDELVVRVLNSLQSRLSPLVEEKVRDTLADVLQMAVDNMATEINQGLHEALRDVVLRAVDQELAASGIKK